MSFTVIREAQSFIRPSNSTPSESLDLSVVDRSPILKYGVQSLHVFKHGHQPAAVIKEALSKALVPYYPLAGRLIDTDEGEVMVECSGEGAWFVAATANCSLEDVNYLSHVPLPISENELLPHLNNEPKLLNVPIMLQVTVFRCGGFVVGLIFYHTVVDGLGAAQFMKAIGDIARGDLRPSIDPIWSRHRVPNPPNILTIMPPFGYTPSFKCHLLTFDLPSGYITKIKSIYFENTGHRCTTFDVSVATLWKIRTRAISIEDPEAPVHLGFVANTRHLLEFLPPKGGYYGNCFFPVTVTSSNAHIISADMVDVVKMIRDGKERLPKEFERWRKGELKDDPFCSFDMTYNMLTVSDWTNLGYSEVDYGWGKPVKVFPFEHYDSIPAAILGRPLAPEEGAWLMAQCVKEEHVASFQELMNRLA